MDAVAFAAGEDGEFFLLIGAGEAEFGDVGAGVHGDAADLGVFETIGNGFPDVLIILEGFAGLFDVGEFDVVGDGDGAFVRFFRAGDHAEEGGFAGTVGADDADDAAGG